MTVFAFFTYYLLTPTYVGHDSENTICTITHHFCEQHHFLMGAPVAQARRHRSAHTCRRAVPLVGAEGRQGKPPLYVRATYEREPSDAVTQRACCRTTAWSGSGL